MSGNSGTGSIHRIVVAQTSGLAELTLTAPLIAGLRAHYRGSSVELVCRKPFSALPSLFPAPPSEITPIDVLPEAHASPSPALLDQVRGVERLFRGRRANLFVAASPAPNWMDWFLACLLRPHDAVAAPKRAAPRGLLRVLLEEFSLPAVEFRGPGALNLSGDQRNAALLGLAGAAPVDAFPWTLPEEVEARTAQTIEALRLQPRAYAVCFPGGAPQCWAPERFWDVLLQLEDRFSCGIVLAGDESEQRQLRVLADCLSERTRVFAARPNDLPVVASLLANAGLYLGNECGFTHLAQCYSVPGVAVFGGGGGWSSRAAWAPGSIALANPLPCFDCGWDCPFARVHCLDCIPVQAVLRAIDDVLADPARPPESRACNGKPETGAAELETVSRRYRRLREENAASAALAVELLHEQARRRRGWTSLR